MKYLEIEQKSQEWWELKLGKVSGTRYGQLISNRENMLIDEMVNEVLDGQCEIGDYIDEDMQFGIDNEPITMDLLESQTGIKFKRGGVILSDFSDIHMSSPDGVNTDLGIIVEVKCTMHGKKHINRFRNGVESSHKGQIVNYFACSDDVKECWFVSYCPFRTERPLIIIKFNRDSIIEETTKKKVTVQEKVIEGRTRLTELKPQLQSVIEQFTTIDF